jgi:hypothetical protein
MNAKRKKEISKQTKMRGFEESQQANDRPQRNERAEKHGRERKKKDTTGKPGNSEKLDCCQLVLVF